MVKLLNAQCSMPTTIKHAIQCDVTNVKRKKLKCRNGRLVIKILPANTATKMIVKPT